MIDFEDFDLDGIGLTVDALDLKPASPLPDLLPPWRRRWWHDSGHETLEDHAAATIRKYARPTLDRLDAGEDDPVFPHQGAIVSLADLTAPFEPWRGDWINETK